MDFAERQLLDQVRTAYARGDVGLDSLVEYGGVTRTFMYHAAKYGWLRLMQWLLKHGADVNISPAGKWKPLHIAAYCGRHEAVILLLDAGAQVDAVDQYEETALHVAGSWGTCDICKLLLSRGASLDMRNDDGEDAETIARSVGNAAVAALLADIRAAGGWSAYATVLELTDTFSDWRGPRDS